MHDRSPGGLYISEPDVIAELLAMRPEKPVQMPAIDAPRFAARTRTALFVTDPEIQIAELHDACIVVADFTIATVQALIPVAEAMLQAARPLVVVAPSIEGDALALLVVNKLRGLLAACALDADAATQAAIASLVGAEIVHAPEAISVERAGRARRVVASELATVIVA
jgi:chaperonin GroEL